ncbi:MAG: HPr family phosphocarrier protein [Elusimicrobia bacterium]|nr:HPr family phosphocarrier protein [Elusimicrobiota bacterium]
MSGPVRIQKTFTMALNQGLHLRPAGFFVQTANLFKSRIEVSKGADKTANGKSILSFLTLEAATGSQVTVTTEGPDAKQAMGALERLFEHWRKDATEECPVCKGEEPFRPF